MHKQKWTNKQPTSKKAMLKKVHLNRWMWQHPISIKKQNKNYPQTGKLMNDKTSF